MLQKICRLIAILFHPAMMPTLGYLLFFFFLSSEGFGIRQVILLSIIFLGTFVVPAFFILTMRYTGYIQTLDMARREERLLPFLLTTVFYTLIAYFMIKKASFDIHVILLMGGVALSMCLTTLVSIVHKTSVHSVGISGLLGFMMGFQFANPSLELLFPIVLLLVFTGIVMSSRLYIQAHTPNEVWSGFLVGFLTCFGIVGIII